MVFLQRAVATQAQELGLVEEEAGLIAAAILAPDTLDGVRQQVEQDLAAGRLRNAQRRAADLPADDPLREETAAVAAEVAAIVRRADAERGLGRDEQAAALLAEAIDQGARRHRAGRAAGRDPASAATRCGRPDGRGPRTDHLETESGYRGSRAVPGRARHGPGPRFAVGGYRPR